MMNTRALLCFATLAIVVNASMTIINKSGYRLYITLDQVSTLYHDVLEDGEIMHRNTGAVHFTVTAKIVDDDFEEPSSFDNFIRHIDILSDWVPSPSGLAKSVAKSVIKRLGKIVAKEIAKGIAKKIAVKVGMNGVKYFGEEFMANLKTKPIDNRKISSAGWYAGKDHILSIWGGYESPLTIYSCRNEAYYPQKTHDYVKDTDICAKFNINNPAGRYGL